MSMGILGVAVFNQLIGRIKLFDNFRKHLASSEGVRPEVQGLDVQTPPNRFLNTSNKSMEWAKTNAYLGCIFNFCAAKDKLYSYFSILIECHWTLLFNLRQFPNVIVEAWVQFWKCSYTISSAKNCKVLPLWGLRQWCTANYCRGGPW